MSENTKYLVPILLIFSFVLSTMQSTSESTYLYSFAYTDSVNYIVYHSVLSFLFLTSVIIFLFILEDKRWAYIVSTLCGVSYLFVFILNFKTILPAVSSITNNPIIVIEVLGIIISMLLIFVSARGAINLTSKISNYN